MSLLIDVLHGKTGARRPLWVMRQAGRYLPEYRELRRRHDFLELCTDPELAAEVTLQPLRRFPLDAAIIFADLMSPIASLGFEVRFEPGPVIERPVKTAADVAALPEPADEEIAPEVPAALRLVRPELAAGQALLGFAGAPWSLAAYLVEGQGRKGFPTLRAMAAAEPALLEKLLRKLSKLVVRYVRAQHRAGADAIQIFDSWAGLLSLRDWRELVRPHLLWILEQMGEAGIPRILFLQDAPQLVEAFAELPSEALAVDWRQDLPELRRRLGDGKVLQGNLDPAILLGGPEATERAARELLGRMPKKGHVMNLGHGILPDTPIESVEALIACVHGELSPEE